VETRVRQPLIKRPGPQATPSGLAAVIAKHAQPIYFRRLAADQAVCPECEHVLGSRSSLQFSDFNMGTYKLVCDVSTGAVWRLVPLSWRLRVFLAVHGIAHPGTRATKRMLAAHYVWPGMASDITRCCKECDKCAHGKVTRNMHAQFSPFQ
jgi:hypothetical protein